MPNAYTLEEVKSFIPGKTWVNLPDPMRESATTYLNVSQEAPESERLVRYYLIVPIDRVNELAQLIGNAIQGLDPTMLDSGEKVVPLNCVLSNSGFSVSVVEFLSGLPIRSVADDEFPTSDV